MLLDFAALVRRLPAEYVALFAPAGRATAEAQGWWYDHFGPSMEDSVKPQNLEEFDAVARRVADMLSPDQRLAGLAPEQRLAGLAEFEQVLALPDPLLRLLPDDDLATFPAEVQATVRTRRGR